MDKIQKIIKLKKVINDPDKIAELFESSEDIDELIGSIISQEKSGFNSICFEKYRKEEEEYLKFIECPDIEEGMFQCNKCKSRKIYTTTKQTRSGDESTTVFAQCVTCKNGWIVNN